MPAKPSSHRAPSGEARRAMPTGAADTHVGASVGGSVGGSVGASVGASVGGSVGAESAEAVVGRQRSTVRGDATRSAIIDAALGLFLEKGYDGTTMRAIATQAGVSLGNAYYYFGSKEHLIQGFYDRAGEEHRIVARSILARTRSFEERLGAVNEAWIETMVPYRSFAASFFRSAADPTSPVSPFSQASAPARNAMIAMFRELIETSDVNPPAAVRDELPELLWLFLMGIVLYWVHDNSEGSARTLLLNRTTSPLVAKAVQFAKLPVARGMVNDLIELVKALKTL